MTTTLSDSKSLLLPMKLDAFVFNEHVCNGGKNEAKIIPINQPNYTFLQLTNQYLANDILDQADLYFSSPAACNSRFMDLGSRLPRENRQGVYLHWMVPRVYRTGVASPAKDSSGQGTVDSSENASTPIFWDPPTRWLVIRKIDDMNTIEPKTARIEEVRAWIVESDRKREFLKKPATKPANDIADIQVDVSPFVSTMNEDDNTVIDIARQAEVFIGMKQDAFDRPGQKTKSWQDNSTADQKININLLNSSNQLFADYQPHNNNVFSILDNLEYDYDSRGKARQMLSVASLSYYVIGWHPKDSKDPFGFDATAESTRDGRVQSLNLSMGESPTQNVKDWLAQAIPKDSGLLCHGAMYNVKWNKEGELAISANKFAERLAMNSPIAVGTTPMDALLAYVSAQDQQNSELVQKLEKSIHALDALLRARDDGVESQRQARDLLTNWNFERADGGQRFFFSNTSGAEGQVTEPPPEDRKDLATLNEKQLFLDCLQRRCRSSRWELFSLWWRQLSDVKGKDHAHATSQLVGPLVKKILSQENTIKKLAADIEEFRKRKSLVSTEPCTLQPFAQQRDPTLLVGGIESGWPSDYLEPLKVRTEGQTLSDPSLPESEAWRPVTEIVIPKLPGHLQTAVGKLIREFRCLDPMYTEPAQSGDAQPPLYHDRISSDGSRRDNWELRQPWFPLYLEWEAEYTHIPFDDWTIDSRVFRAEEPAKLQYVIKSDKNLSGPGAILEGTRTFSGRELILPQPSFSLESKITQLFSQTPVPILDNHLTAEERVFLQKNIRSFPFLSSPLSGFRDHLVTRMSGSHVKPNNTAPHGSPVPLKQAIDAASTAGFDEQAIRLIGVESDLTPYAYSVRNDTESPTLFKPVAHGQFRFTKVNVIDKFGQAIHAIEPTPLKKGPAPVYPCISEFLKPRNQLGSEEPHVVRPSGNKMCEFVQLPPQINQLARLNSTFVTIKGPKEKPPKDPVWRPTDEWENPIWGLVMVNYADQGVQVFLPSGDFYREVRFGGPKGTQVSAPWLPFAPPDNPPSDTSPQMAQLQALVDKLQKQPGYLQSFIDMSTKALYNSPASPSSYAASLNAAIGKPMALVNVAWSLELASPPFSNQSALDDSVLPMHLLPTGKDPAKDPDAYRFPVKLGDKERLFDGVVGYFEAQNPPPKVGQPSKLENLYTYFTADDNPESGLAVEQAVGSVTVESDDETDNGSADESDGEELDPRRPINSETFPTLSAFYIDPMAQKTPEAFSTERDSNLRVFSIITDPFVPIHAFTSLLPINSLTLPPWTWQEAMNRMTAFLHLGPLLVTKDVPPYNPDHRLKSGYNLGFEGKDSGNPTQPLCDDVPIGIPAAGLADWAWFQAYWTKKLETEKEEDENAEENETVYMPLKLDKVDARPRYEPGPYTAVEGYLQMRRPIMGPIV